METPSSPPAGEVVLRAPRVGDLSFVSHRSTAMFARDYGFDWSSEGLIFDILSRFIADFDPEKERAWIAELDGVIVGSIILMRGDELGTAKLRMFYVEPDARGRGIGASLVETCVGQARAFGYNTLSLWTFDALVSARRVYEAAGFALASENRQRVFGQDINSQIWTLDLRAG